jgi:hypothetical protein
MHTSLVQEMKVMRDELFSERNLLIDIAKALVTQSLPWSLN